MFYKQNRCLIIFSRKCVYMSKYSWYSLKMSSTISVTQDERLADSIEDKLSPCEKVNTSFRFTFIFSLFDKCTKTLTQRSRVTLKGLGSQRVKNELSQRYLINKMNSYKKIIIMIRNVEQHIIPLIPDP